MRVLVLTNLYPNPTQPHRAPYNRHQLRLLNETSPVRVIAPVAWTLPHPPRQETLDGIQVDHPRYLFPPRVLRSYYGHCYYRSVRRCFHRAVAEFRPDIVFAPWAYPDGWTAVKLAREAKLPVVIQVHGSDVKLLNDFPAKRTRTAEALEACDGVVAVSQDLANDVAALGATNVKVNYDGVDDALFNTDSNSAKQNPGTDAPGSPSVLFVGNLVEVKNVAALIDAMVGVAAKLVIVGEGPLRETLKAQAVKSDIDVTFTGSVPLTELPRYYHAASLFVLPSRSEGVPNVLLEASACGVPWVASNVGGIPEITHLGASRLVPSGDVYALRAAIIDMLKNPPPLPIGKPRLRTEAVAELELYLRSFLPWPPTPDP